MTIALFLVPITGLLATFQMGTSNGMAGMGDGMIAACVVIGLLIFTALLEFVILEFLWIKVWSQRLRNERRTLGAGSRAA